jgi:hypothetical protein
MGEWKRNRPSGFGFEAYPNGSYYQGTFENDQRDGIGVYEFPDGLYYSGGWRLGKRFGSGIATDVHNSKFVLTYDRNGKLLSKHHFATQGAGEGFGADTAEREVVAEVLRVSLQVVCVCVCVCACACVCVYHEIQIEVLHDARRRMIESAPHLWCTM